jgi:hypothetical protein
MPDTAGISPHTMYNLDLSKWWLTWRFYTYKLLTPPHWCSLTQETIIRRKPFNLSPYKRETKEKPLLWVNTLWYSIKWLCILVTSVPDIVYSLNSLVLGAVWIQCHTDLCPPLDTNLPQKKPKLSIWETCGWNILSWKYSRKLSFILQKQRC